MPILSTIPTLPSLTTLPNYVTRPSADTIISELSGMAKDFLLQPKGINHFEQLRQFFESSLVRYAAEHASDKQIAKLANALEINSKSLENNDLFSLFIVYLLRCRAIHCFSPFISLCSTG